MDRIGFFESSEKWERSLGKGVFKLHFREKEGTGHAVCDRASGKCEVHYDKFNPHENFVRHIWHDSPEVILHGLSAVGLTLSMGGLLSYFFKKS